MRRFSIVLLAAGAVLFFRTVVCADVAKPQIPVPNSASTVQDIGRPSPRVRPRQRQAEFLARRSRHARRSRRQTGAHRIGSARICKTNREWMQDEDAMNRKRGTATNTDFANPSERQQVQRQRWPWGPD